VLKGVHLSLLIGAIRPEPAPAEVVEALVGVQVTISSGQRSGFQLTFAIGKLSAINRTLLPDGYFDPPRRVIVIATIGGVPEVLMDGVITRQELTPSNEPGQSRLVITGEDVSRMMDLIDLSGFPFPALPIEGRVAIALAKYPMYGVVPRIIPSALVVDIPNPLKTVPGQRGTDLAYVTYLARMVGYVFYVEPGPRPGMNVAYWGPEIRVGQSQPPLIVNADASSNVESLNFSFDGFQKTLFVILLQLPVVRIPFPIPIPEVNPLSPPLGKKLPPPLRVEPLTGLGKYHPFQAGVIGLARAAQSADVVTGGGSLDVLRYGRALRARRLVEVRGAGMTYDGTYFVRSVTHTIKPGEYKQSFTLSRNALIARGATA
jgi:hypothetical protein